MPTLRERFTDLLLGDQRRKLEESAQLLYNAYLEGPFVLPPDQLLAQLKEQDAALLTDLVHQLYWEHLGTPGYSLDLTAERGRAIDESRRLWKYNPLAQWMIWLWTNYGFGENIVITPEDEAAIEVWEEFWKADRNQIVLAQDRIADRLSNWLLVDGDRFLAFYASTLDGEATVRRINTKEIVEIVTDPDDSSVPLFYKRQWTNTKSQQLTWYYPDWEAFFRGDLDRAELPQGAIRADEQNTGTTVCILHISFNGKDEDSLYGWPLLAAGSPWVRSQKRFLEARLSVAQSKAMYVRKATTPGGSRAVDAIRRNLQTTLSRTQAYETNPRAVAGSTLIENQAVDTTDLPMTTGASDAKTDGEMFSWMAGLSGGVFPHYMGLGDAYRLATATSMEKPLEMQFSRYQVFWGAQFRKKVRIVLQFKEKYGDATFQTYEAEVSTDKMVEVDLDGMSQALGKVFTTIINPQAELRMLPAEVTQGMLKASLKTILQALGVDAEAILGDEVWEVEEEGELEEATVLALQNYRSGLIDADDLVAFLLPAKLEEGGPGSGWFAPPKGTHIGKEGVKRLGPKGKAKPGSAPPMKGSGSWSEKMGTFFDEATEEDDWLTAEDEDRERTKAAIISELAKRTDMSEAEANKFIEQWAHSSNDEDMRSLFIQQDAADLFDVPLSEWQEGRIKSTMESGEEWRIQRLFPEEQQKSFITAMYDHTQEELASAGFEKGDTIRLYRGVDLGGEKTPWNDGDVLDYNKGNTLESWSISDDAAREFGDVMVIDVPVTSVVSTARTGMGCLTEGEVIILGSVPGTKVLGWSSEEYDVEAEDWDFDIEYYDFGG